MTMEEPAYSAFLSHASADREKAEAICASLEERGLRCWVAPRDVRAGREFGEEIIHGIENSRCLVLVLSEAANQSIYVRREVERAVSKRKPVFPVRIEDVLPSPSLELFVSSTHWIDAWSGPLVGHASKLADELKNPDVLQEARMFSSQAYRRKRLPAWIGMGLAFLALVTAIVVGVSIALRNEISRHSPADATRIAAKAMEIDPSGVGKDSFEVAIKPLARDPSKLVLAVRVIKPPTTTPGSVGLTGAMIEYALDGGSSFERLGPLMQDQAESSPYQSQDELRRARSVTIRIRGIMGQKLGPFTYAVDGAAAGIAAVTREGGDEPLKELVSLVNEQMKVKVGDLLPVARCLWVGTDPANPALRIPVAGLEEQLAAAEQRNRHWRDAIANIPVLPGKPTYARIEFLDGSRTPVETFLPPSPGSGRTGLGVQAREPGGPELYVLPKSGFSPAGGRGEYIPALWIEASEVRYSFDDGGGIPAQRMDHTYGVGHSFSIEEPLRPGTLRLEVTWADGRPDSTFHYPLPDPSAVLLENAMMHFERREKDLVAVRFLSAKEPPAGKEEAYRARERVRKMVSALRTNFRAPDDPVLRIGITKEFGGGPDEDSWLAVAGLHYGTTAGQLTGSIPGPVTPEDLLQDRKLDDETFFRLDLPADTPGFYYKFRFRDGSESTETRLRIEEAELPLPPAAD